MKIGLLTFPCLFDSFFDGDDTEYHQILEPSVLYLVFLGKRRFLQLYFFSGFVSLATWISFNFSVNGAVVGASGAICGVVAAFATIRPNDKALLFFVMPIRVRTLMLALVPISLGLWLFSVGPKIAHMAHAGGAIAGYLFMKWDRKKSLNGRKRPADNEGFF